MHLLQRGLVHRIWTLDQGQNPGPGVTLKPKHGGHALAALPWPCGVAKPPHKATLFNRQTRVVTEMHCGAANRLFKRLKVVCLPTLDKRSEP